MLCKDYRRSLYPPCPQLCHKPSQCSHPHIQEHRCHRGKCPPCTLPCGKLLPCGHQCLAVCHEGEPCPPCAELVEIQCAGGHETRRVHCSERNTVVCCDQPCGKLLNCGKHVGKQAICSIEMLFALPPQRHTLRNMQTAVSGTSGLFPSLLARVLPRGSLRSLPPAREASLFLRENVEDVRVLGGEWEAGRGLFLVRKGVRKAAAGVQTWLSTDVPCRVLRAMRAGNRSEMSLRSENRADSVLESAANGGIQRFQCRSDSSLLLCRVQFAELHHFAGFKQATDEFFTDTTRANHRKAFCIAALAVDRNSERAGRCTFAGSASFSDSLACFFQQTTHNHLRSVDAYDVDV